MNNHYPQGKKPRIEKVVVGTRYPVEKAELLHVVRERRGKLHLSDVATIALDDLLVKEGLLKAA